MRRTLEFFTGINPESTRNMEPKFFDLSRSILGSLLFLISYLKNLTSCDLRVIVEKLSLKMVQMLPDQF